MDAAQRESQKKWFVLVLDDEKKVGDALEAAINRALKKAGNMRVIACQSDADARSAIECARDDGYTLKVVLCDQVRGEGKGGANREWGIEFLRFIKKEYPDAFRIMFSGQSNHEEMQRMLEEGLIHDFTAKSPDTGEPTVKNRIVGKIVDMVKGVNAGNVQNPSADKEFEQFLNQWIDSLPEGENTQMRSFDGTTFRLGELRTNSTRRQDFRRAFEAARLDRLIVFNKAAHEGEQA